MSFGTRRARRVGRQALLIVAISTVALTIIGSVVVGAAAYSAANELTADLPDLTTEAPRVDETTKVFARDGTLLADFFFAENRVPVPLRRVPKVLIDAVISVEDQRFFEHRGIDYEAIGRAALADVRSGRLVEGGSTITQQYVKNLYGQRERTLRRKIREALMAYRLERRYPKALILERYLNTIYLGQSVYGVEAAARMYFGKSARRVTLPEAAFLAGLIRSPNTLSPYLSRSTATRRRNHVLGMMLEQGRVTTAQAAAAARTPLVVLTPRLPKGRAPYFLEFAKQTLIRRYGADVVFKGGLRVTTTLDLRMQELAEQAAWGFLDRSDDPAVALVALEPRTGAIRAIVGGKDFKRASFNLATQGHRQPGSAFKVFVLAAALSQGYSLDTRIDSDPGAFELPEGGTWSVSNATEGGGGGRISLREATVHSVNAVFARIMMDLGPEAIAGIAERMGIMTELNRDPAIALGGLRTGVTALEMASAYGTLATGGFHVAATPIETVSDTSGKVVWKNRSEGEAVLDRGVAALVTQALTGVLREGTGRRAAIGRPAAGKTGTTQDYHDAWFVGYTPELACAVWVGYPDRQRPMYDVHGRRVAGGSFPAMIWAAFMSEALKGTKPKPLVGLTEHSLVKVRICSDSNLLAGQYCPRPITAGFLVGQEPEEQCDMHTSPPALTVPNLTGSQVGQATALLAASGFVAVTTYVQSDKRAGIVLSQSPEPGQKVPPGTVVTLVVAGNPLSGGPTDRPPRAAFSVSPDHPKVGQPVTFDGSASIDAEGAVGRWVWAYGDGATGDGMRSTHPYAAVGDYQVTLTVYDSTGQAASVSRRLSVRP